MLKNRAILALGTNLGDREGYCQKAVEALNSVSESPIRLSSIYETAPLGPQNQNHYLNLCVEITCILNPFELLAFCKNTEVSLGRLHREKWGSREIDIDIIFFGNQFLSTSELIIPHPEFTNRSFVLTPLVDLIPDYIVPKIGKTVSEIYAQFGDKFDPEAVRKLDFSLYETS